MSFFSAASAALTALHAIPANAEKVIVETSIAAPAAKVWEAVRDVYAVARSLVPGIIIKVDREGDVRHVTFASGFQVSERIMAIDDGQRSVTYEAFGGRARFHRSTMHVQEAGGQAKLVWTTWFLPAELRSFIESNMQSGSDVAKRHLEAQHGR